MLIGRYVYRMPDAWYLRHEREKRERREREEREKRVESRE